jgi:hypothetical protein
MGDLRAYVGRFLLMANAAQVKSYSPEAGVNRLFVNIDGLV